MNKTILKVITLSLSLSTTIFTFSQNQQVIDYGNTREGEHVEYCKTHKKMAERLENPEAYAQYLLDQEELNNVHLDPQEKGTIYTIPVVFHILHNGGVENISNEQIMDQLNIFNRDYRRLNDDANDVVAAFSGMPADIEIQFALATKAPDGTCFNGITRTNSPMSLQGDDGGNQVDAIIAGNDVYQGEWAGNRYLNIFVCGNIGGAAGYTYKPSNWGGTSMYNGIWILHNYVGSIGTASVNSSRALTHEVGHWLNLDHTWGGNNNPGNASSCSDDDAVDDTPTCIGVTSCNLSKNSCDDDDWYWGTAMPDNVENYMDYSYCSKMYTEGQKTRMRNALNSSTGGRNNLWKTANLNLVGVNNPVLCKADFSAPNTAICVGDTVAFQDLSYNAVSGWTWTFEGGNPATSTDQNPTVNYSTPGIYQVSLTATDGSTNLTSTKLAFIHVFSSPSTLPFYDGFETYSTLAGIPNWRIINEGENETFKLATGFGNSGNQCVQLNNYTQTGTNYDYLESAPVDLSTLADNENVTLSFRYAYRKKVSTNNEMLRLLASENCGNDWVIRRTVSGSSLSSQTASSSWTPSQEDWVTVHVSNIVSSFFTSDFRYKFEFKGNGGNNIFIDDINLYKGESSGTIVVGIEELKELENVQLYPNPATKEANLSFELQGDMDIQIAIKDITGKTVQLNSIQGKSGSNLVLMNVQDLKPGIYFVTMQGKTIHNVIQFVVE
jgi:PKD repeat protein